MIPDKPEQPGRAFSHLDAAGHFTMVDVGDKPMSVRTALASGAIRMAPETLKAIQDNTLKKGDVIPVARLAGFRPPSGPPTSSPSVTRSLCRGSMSGLPLMSPCRACGSRDS